MIKTKETLARVNEFIDIKMGFIGAVFMGSLVFWINFEHGWNLALIAGLKQLTYTLFFGGLFLKMAENIAITRKSRIGAIIIGGFVPMVCTVFLTYTVHAFKGTPEPIYSTIPTLILHISVLLFGVGIRPEPKLTPNFCHYLPNFIVQELLI